MAKTNSQKNVVARVDHLRLTFFNPITKKTNLVIRDVSFELREREVLAFIGESGSGKSVLTSTLLGLQGKNAIIDNGTIMVDAIEVTDFSDRDWEKAELRGQVISQVFQDPMAALNPTMKIGAQLIEGAILNKRVNSRKEAKEDAIALLKRIGIDNAETVVKLYPHQLSGGMRQRVCIACVLLCQPKILIFDEPTTALDPTIQAEILHIIQEIKENFNVAMIFISHDLGVVGSIADRIAIMYAGKIVEYGTAREIMYDPRHPYTWGLIRSMPDVNTGETLYTIPGSVPSNFNQIVGDAFAPRNEYALDIDFKEAPPFFKISPTHFAATWLLDPRAPKIKPPSLIIKRKEMFFKPKTKAATASSTKTN